MVDFLARLKEMREPVAAGERARPELTAYLEKVRHHAYKVTDEEVAKLLAAGLSQDEIYEATMYAAMTAGIERAELVQPWAAVQDAGHQPVLISPKSGDVQLFEHLDKAETHAVDITVGEADYAQRTSPGALVEVPHPEAVFSVAVVGCRW